MMDRLGPWLERLGALPDRPNVHNLYSARTAEGRVRLANLWRYLEVMSRHEPLWLVVGEAPGYQGSYRTGIPFASEAIMLGPQNQWGLFGGEANGFVRVFDDGRIWSEPTATVVQRVMDEVATPMIGWATFPLHPYRPGDELSNRAPNRQEIALGTEVLAELLVLLRPRRVVAMGNVAAACLAGMGVSADKARHPSHGGATKFREQLKTLVDA